MLNFGLIGGGGISRSHIYAATMNGNARLVCGCFSRNKEKNLQFAKGYGVEPDRVYDDFSTLIEFESRNDQKLDFVIVCTPNNSHYEICKALMLAGINVVCDKPLAIQAHQARELVEIAAQNHLKCMVTYTFFGLPFIQYLRKLCIEGKVGTPYFIEVRYFRGARLSEIYNNAITTWRFTEEISGMGGSIADLGSHVEFLARFTIDKPIKAVLANLIQKPGNVELDTTDSVFVKFENGLDGLFVIAQAACGHDNDISIEILGDQGTLHWSFKDPESVKVDLLKGETIIYRNPGLNDPIFSSLKRPKQNLSSQPQIGFNVLYYNFIESLQNKEDSLENNYPDFHDGEQGVKFIEACVESHRKGNIWTELK